MYSSTSLGTLSTLLYPEKSANESEISASLTTLWSKNVTVPDSLLVIDMFILGEILSVNNPPVKRKKSTGGGTYGATVFGAVNQIFKKSIQSVAAGAFFQYYAHPSLIMWIVRCKKKNKKPTFFNLQ